MGRQINFYFDEKDEQEFLKLHQLNDIVFLKFRNMKSPQYEEIQLGSPVHVSDSDSQTYMCFRHDLNNIEYQDYDDGKLFYIKGVTSPVIEFSRSRYRQNLNLLGSGRLWYEHKYWAKDEDGNDVLLEKSKELEKLYNSLARWIRKHCTRLDNGNYIAPHAMELYKNGAEISP